MRMPWDGPRSFKDSELDAPSVRVLTALRTGGDLAERSEAEKLRNENRVLREDNGKLREALADLEKKLHSALGKAGAAPDVSKPQPLVGGSATPRQTTPPVAGSE